MKKSFYCPFVPFFDQFSPGGSRGRLAFLGVAGSIICCSSSASAVGVNMTASDPMGASSFNSAGLWDNLEAPSAGNDYYSGPFTVRTPNDSGSTYVFGGDSLSLDSGGRLLGKSTGPQTVDFPNGNGLILNGGILQMANSATGNASMKVTGKILVSTDSWLGALGSGSSNSVNFETLEIAAPISGSGWLTVAGNANGNANTGVVKLSAANPFTGFFSVEQPAAFASATNRLLQLNHLEAIRYGGLLLNTTAANSVSFAAEVNSGPFLIGSLGGGASQILRDTAGTPITLDIGGNNENSSFTGVLTGTGNLIKSGTGILEMFAAQTYTGNTTVAGGTLSLATPSLANASTVTIATGATLELRHNEIDFVASLVLNGVAQPPGVYNSTNTGGRISGSGSIEVSDGPPPPEPVIMIASDTGNNMITSFNGDVGHWSVPGVPIPANDYRTGAFVLRTPALTASGDGGTFTGKSLTIDAGGRFLGKAGASQAGSTVVQTITVNDLILNGGAMDQASAPTSSAVLIVGGNIRVAADSIIGALGATSHDGVFETLEITATVSGSAGLSIGNGFNNGDNSGLVKLSAANPYTGTLTVGQPGRGFIASATNRLLQLNHPQALQAATLVLTTSSINGMSFSTAANTGPFKIGALAGTASQVLADTSGAAVTLDVGGAGLDSNFNGILTGPGHLQKSGTGTFELTEMNTYTGNTTVSGGTLGLAQPFLSDNGSVSVASGAFLNLPHGETDVVAGLVLNGVSQPVGVYGSANSGGRITGSGKIQVVIPSGFTSFMDGFPGLTVAERAADADPDGDGISNLMEYALADSDPTVPNRLPSLENGTITFNKRALAVSAGDITYVIETSPTLGVAPSPWTVVSGTDTAAAISYALPIGEPKAFVRLKVVSN